MDEFRKFKSKNTIQRFLKQFCLCPLYVPQTLRTESASKQCNSLAPRLYDVSNFFTLLARCGKLKGYGRNAKESKTQTKSVEITRDRGYFPFISRHDHLKSCSITHFKLFMRNLCVAGPEHGSQRLWLTHNHCVRYRVSSFDPEK